MKYQLYREQQLECTIENAWNFFVAAKNIFKITPEEMHFKLLSSLENDIIYEGMTIDYSVAPLFGIPLRWTTEIQEVVHQKSFTDIQKRGPYKIWHHRHDFIANENGVLMIDTVDYELPMGKLGDWMHHLIVKDKITALFDYRQKEIHSILHP